MTLDEARQVYRLKPQHAAGMVIDNVLTRGLAFETGGNGRWCLAYIPPFQAPKNEPVFIMKRVVDDIRKQRDMTGEEIRAKMPDRNEGQIRDAVDAIRACDDDETLEGQYQPGFRVARRRPSR